MHQYAFEKLKVWVESKELIKEIYLLAKSFPSFESFNFTSQLQRSSLSITSNIVEGSSKHTHKNRTRLWL